MAPTGWQGDPFSPYHQPDFSDLDTTYHGPGFVPSDTFNDTIADGSVVPGDLPTFFGCVCNCSYVSYACCDSPTGNVSEPAENNLGHLENCHPGGTGSNISSKFNASGNSFLDVVNTVSESTQPATATESDPSPSHHVCSGYCYGAARSCSWQYAGDCKCSAPKNEILFWKSAPCIATASNPNKQHDKRQEARNPSLLPGYKGPLIDPAREPGICNSSYISYACAGAENGIVHEPLTNWLGAMLPKGAKEYPPIPQEFLDLHGIAEQPDLGPLDLPYWS